MDSDKHVSCFPMRIASLSQKKISGTQNLPNLNVWSSEANSRKSSGERFIINKEKQNGLMTKFTEDRQGKQFTLSNRYLKRREGNSDTICETNEYDQLCRNSIEEISQLEGKGQNRHAMALTSRTREGSPDHQLLESFRKINAKIDIKTLRERFTINQKTQKVMNYKEQTSVNNYRSREEDLSQPQDAPNTKLNYTQQLGNDSNSFTPEKGDFQGTRPNDRPNRFNFDKKPILNQSIHNFNQNSCNNNTLAKKDSLKKEIEQEIAIESRLKSMLENTKSDYLKNRIKKLIESCNSYTKKVKGQDMSLQDLFKFIAEKNQRKQRSTCQGQKYSQLNLIKVDDFEQEDYLDIEGIAEEICNRFAKIEREEHKIGRMIDQENYINKNPRISKQNFRLPGQFTSKQISEDIGSYNNFDFGSFEGKQTDIKKISDQKEFFQTRFTKRTEKQHEFYEKKWGLMDNKFGMNRKRIRDKTAGVLKEKIEPLLEPYQKLKKKKDEKEYQKIALSVKNRRSSFKSLLDMRMRAMKKMSDKDRDETGERDSMVRPVLPLDLMLLGNLTRLQRERECTLFIGMG